MKRERVFITAVGVVSPLGNDVATFERRILAGESGVCAIRDGKDFAADFPIPYAAIVDDRELTEWKRIPTQIAETFLPLSGREDPARSWLFSLACLDQILNQCKKFENLDAIVYGTPEGVGYEVASEAVATPGDKIDLNRFNSEASLELMNRALEVVTGQSVAHEKLYCVNAACATSNQAIGMAFQRLRTGTWQRALVGGVDSRCTRANIMNFHMLSALTSADVAPETASRPFDRTRSGFVRGEGAGLLLLETASAQKESGNPIWGEVLGYGISTDAYRLTDPREDGSSLIHAMKIAVEDAKATRKALEDSTDQSSAASLSTDGTTACGIDYISAHGTSTPLNDKTETAAIKALFGEDAYRIPVSSQKSQFGHTTVAAGVLESIACLMILKKQILTPTLNLKDPDPECDLDYVAEGPRPANVRTILNNNIGFGGQNVCIVLGKAQ